MEDLEQQELKKIEEELRKSDLTYFQRESIFKLISSYKKKTMQLRIAESKIEEYKKMVDVIKTVLVK